MNKHMVTRDQNGFVAIFTVMVIMGLLTLITLGFSNITRQAQRRTLDDALNTQAFYAAETGVNRVAQLIDDGAITGSASKDNCDDPSNIYNYDVDAALGVAISCLKLDMTPSNLYYSSIPKIGEGQSIATYMRPWPLDTTTNIRSMRIDFDTDSPGDLTDADDERPNRARVNGSPQLTSAANWGSQIGVLRVDMVPVPSTSVANSLERGEMAENMYTFFLNPSRNADSTPSTSPFQVSPTHQSQGTSLLVRCTNSTTDNRCSAVLNLTGTAANAYYMRLHSYYNATSASITLYDGANGTGNVLDIYGSQVLVDSTGRVGEISRRIQVRLPLNPIPGYHEPFSILSGGSICKRIIGVPGDSGADMANVPGPDQALCNPAQP